MKYIIAGDVHGKWERVEEALAKEGKKIFVGDFQDSFDRSIADHAKCYDLVLEAIDKGEARAIFGNHELSYMMGHHRCSGYTSARKDMFVSYEKRISDKFEPYLLLAPDFLVSHAGLTEHIWEMENLTLDSLSKKLDEWWPDTHSPMHQIGRYRGGWATVGGLFWCDFNAEFEPITGLNQVFGHTAGKGIRKRGNAYCIDCLDHENSYLELDL